MFEYLRLPASTDMQVGLLGGRVEMGDCLHSMKQITLTKCEIRILCAAVASKASNENERSRSFHLPVPVDGGWQMAFPCVNKYWMENTQNISIYLRTLPSLLLHPFDQSTARMFMTSPPSSIYSGFNSIVIISSGHLKIEVQSQSHIRSNFLQIAINNWNVWPICIQRWQDRRCPAHRQSTIW